jgi:cysteine desulfurase/selenocysteine lyase
MSQTTDSAIAPAASVTPIDVSRVRQEFPILRQRIGGKPLVYLDSAATTQKPQAVLDAIVHYYTHDNANVHRGVHRLSERATASYEAAREKVRRFINAEDVGEVVFVRGTTEGINLVAQTFGRTRVGPGDEVVIAAMEHHSNIVPWQLLCDEKGATLRVVPMSDEGVLDLDAYAALLTGRTRLVAMVHLSNAIGTVNPIEAVIRLAHERDVPVLIDGAQAASHLPIDVRALDCDFYTFSGHKLYGPTGIGVLYGKRRWLEAMPPYQGGGDMISSVTFERTSYNVLPYKFEAGTPNIAGVVGLGAAIDYVDALGLDRIAAHEADVLDYATSAVASIPGLRLIGTAPDKAAVLSFVMADIHPHDIGTLLDREGVAIRTGHHCCQPLMNRFGLPATARASLGLYNTRDDIDVLCAGLEATRKVFA